MNDLIELFMQLDWIAVTLILSPIVYVPLIFWLLPKRGTDYYWAVEWERKIDQAIRDVKKHYPKEKHNVMRQVLKALFNELEHATGPVREFALMPKPYQSTWIYLFKRIRDLT